MSNRQNLRFDAVLVWSARKFRVSFAQVPFHGVFREISNFVFNTEIYIALVLLIQNIHSLRGLYLTVFEPLADK